LSDTAISRNLTPETYDVARMYERRINPNFWDLVRSGKRRKEFNQAFGRMAVDLKDGLRRETISMSAEERRATVTSRIIERKHDIERINAEEMARERPQRGKIATWFAEKSGFVKGALTGATAFLISGAGATVVGGFMLDKLGRTNTDANQDVVQEAAARANGNLRTELERSGDNVMSAADALRTSFDEQIERARKPIVDDAKAMLIGGAVGTLAANIAVEMIEAARYAEALEAAQTSVTAA